MAPPWAQAVPWAQCASVHTGHLLCPKQHAPCVTAVGNFNSKDEWQARAHPASMALTLRTPGGGPRTGCMHSSNQDLCSVSAFGII